MSFVGKKRTLFVYPCSAIGQSTGVNGNSFDALRARNVRKILCVASNDKHLPLRSEIIQNQKFEDSLNMVSPLTAFDPKLSFCAIRTNRKSFVRIILDACQS